MTKKEQHPGGVKLTAKTARTLAMQEFGTARGRDLRGHGLHCCSRGSVQRYGFQREIL